MDLESIYLNHSIISGPNPDADGDDEEGNEEYWETSHYHHCLSISMIDRCSSVSWDDWSCSRIKDHTGPHQAIEVDNHHHAFCVPWI